MENFKSNYITLSYLAILIAVSFVLGLIKLFELPVGGSITAFSLFPIALAGYLFGVKDGIIVGVSVGILNLICGGFIVHPIQAILDYPLGFGALGLSGLMFRKKHGLLSGYIIGIFGKYICSVISGVIFFSAYVPENFNAFTWALWYNAVYVIIEGGITIAFILTFQKKFQILRNKINRQLLRR